MTVRAPMLNGDSDSAESFRLALSGLWLPASALHARTGVTSTPVLTGTGNLTATVSAFTAVIQGTSNAMQGPYPVALDSAATVTLGAGNTQPRIDLISIQVQDSNYDGSGQLRGQIVVTAGTPAASPVAPAAPSSSLSLWTVAVPANATSITWTSAVAAYSRTAAAGGITPVGVSTDKPAVANGVAYRHRLDVTASPGTTSPLESSTDGVNWSPVYDASGLAFGAWTNATLASGMTAGSPAPQYSYNPVTGICYLRGIVNTSSGMSAGGSAPILTGLPSATNFQGWGVLTNTFSSAGGWVGIGSGSTLELYSSQSVSPGGIACYLGGSYSTR